MTVEGIYEMLWAAELAQYFSTYVGQHVYWLAQIESSTSLGMGEENSLLVRGVFVLGVSRKLYENQLKGCLIFPAFRQPLDRIVGGKNLPTMLDLDDWQDPVEQALQAVNLFPDDVPPSLDRWRYSLTVSTDIGYGSLTSNSGRSGRPAADQLWIALMDVLAQFIERYDDDEMREFFAHLGLP